MQACIIETHTICKCHSWHVRPDNVVVTVSLSLESIRHSLGPTITLMTITAYSIWHIVVVIAVAKALFHYANYVNWYIAISILGHHHSTHLSIHK